MINSGQCGIDKEMKKETLNNLSYWKNVLHRVVETLKFLTSRGLALRGQNEHFGSEQNGNYLGCLELIAKFDPFISEHIKNMEIKDMVMFLTYLQLYAMNLLFLCVKLLLMK